LLGTEDLMPTSIIDYQTEYLQSIYQSYILDRYLKHLETLSENLSRGNVILGQLIKVYRATKFILEEI